MGPKNSTMSRDMKSYKPKYLADGTYILPELTANGQKIINEYLSTEADGTQFLTTGNHDYCNRWLTGMKEGKKRDKMIMVAMASQYTPQLKQIDCLQGKVLQLVDTTQSQEQQINSLRQENAELTEKVQRSSSKVLQLKATTKSQEREITSQLQENAQLLESKIFSQQQMISLLTNQVEELKGRVMQLNQEISTEKSKTAFQNDEITRLKQRVTDLEEETEKLKDDKIPHEPNNQLCRPATTSTKVRKFWMSLTEIVGPSAKTLELYYDSWKRNGEPLQEFLHIIFISYVNHNPMITGSEYNTTCSNCYRKGHIKAECRRPGGDMEVGPNVCYTCGEYGHIAWYCDTYDY